MLSTDRNSHMAQWTWALRLTCLAIIVTVLLAIALCAFAVRHALVAERNLHAMIDATNACHSYVDEHEGAWPRSWEDIDPYVRDGRAHITRPRVTIDFDADPAILATQDSSSFTGIQPNLPIYDAYQSFVDALIETLKQHHSPNIDET